MLTDRELQDWVLNQTLYKGIVVLKSGLKIFLFWDRLNGGDIKVDIVRGTN